MSLVRTSGRSRVLRAVGVVLVLAGVAMLGAFAWQLYGTTWVATREQRTVVAAVERVWSEPRTAGDQDTEDRALADGVEAIVRIPALGASYAVPARRGDSDAVLAGGFGVLPGSPEIGGPGNLALSAHRVTHGEPLRDMAALKPGDRVEVETAEGIFVYVLDTPGDGLRVGFEQTWVTAPDPVDPATGQRPPGLPDAAALLTLVTCAEIFHTDDRLVAFGHLVEVRERSGT